MEVQPCSTLDHDIHVYIHNVTVIIPYCGDQDYPTGFIIYMSCDVVPLVYSMSIIRKLLL